MFTTPEIIAALVVFYAVAYGLRWVLRRTGVTEAPESGPALRPEPESFHVLVVGTANDALLHAVTAVLRSGRPTVNMTGAPPDAMRTLTFLSAAGPVVRNIPTVFSFCMAEVPFLELDAPGTLQALQQPWDVVVVTSAISTALADAMEAALAPGRPALLRCPDEEVAPWAALRSSSHPSGAVGSAFVKAVVRRALERRRDM